VPRTSAGILVFRHAPHYLEVLLAHPGGPFWARKDDGAWTIPKGELGQAEDPLLGARREFEEEMGQAIDGRFIPLGEVTQPGGKRVIAWAIESDFNPARLRSNRFTLEWPPKSGRRQEFPEVDRAAWFDPDTARRKILRGQLPFIDRLLAL
jgi:predicted NUDIX family NTP pyrophosphohydrolase